MNDYDVLIVPGLRGSGPAHWQTWWEGRDSRCRRVQQRDWEAPMLDEWAEAIERTINASARPVFIVAHSFGCLATARLSRRKGSMRVLGAFLVAMANPDRFDVARSLLRHPLPFPSLLAASRNDTWMSYEEALAWSRIWRSEFVDLGYAGHVNTDSGFGAWPEGERLFERFAEAAYTPS